MWFITKGHRGGSRRIKDYGCGLIAFADLILYLAVHRDKKLPAPLKPFFEIGSIPDKDRYMKYVRYLDRKYLPVIPKFGLSGYAIAISLNLFFLIRRLPYRAWWMWTLSSGRMLARMEQMLENDIPVIFSIGPNTPFVWVKKGIPFYSKDLSGDFIVRETVCAHYVTLTGIFRDPKTERTMLRISSWGKELFVDYNEYRAYIRRRGGRFTSSMIYIHANPASSAMSV